MQCCGDRTCASPVAPCGSRRAPTTPVLPALGLVVGKRAAARAVDRNRVKRCIRESFRMVMNDLPAVDVVVRLVAAPEPRGAVQRSLASLWRQLARDGGRPSR